MTVSRWQPRRNATGSAGGAAWLVRVVDVAASVVVLIVVAGILLVLLKANPANSIVSHVHEWARSLTGPFDGMFTFDNPHVAIAVNWGIAAIVYVIAAELIVRLISRTHR